MAKTMKKLDLKLQTQQQGWPKSQTQQENTTKMKIWKLRQRISNVRASTFWATIG